MAGVRLRGRHADHLLVPSHHIRHVSDPSAARVLARRMLESPDLAGLLLVGSSRLGGGSHELPSEDELVRALLEGDLVVVEVERPLRLMDPPRARPLLELAGSEPMGMPEPVRTPSWVGVRVVDPRGRPLPGFAVRVDDPAGKRHDARLDGEARARVDGLVEDGACVVTLSSVPVEGR
jgi:hypothetical protein